MSHPFPTRREVIASGVATAALAPMFVPTSAFGANDKVSMALIGCGGMGNGNMRAMFNFPDVQFVGVCDPHEKNLQATAGRVNKKYGGSDCKTYKDFREVCANKDIDAVIVATPDHWHGLAAVEAARSGKDIYCQKPMTHLFTEGRILADAVKKNKRIFQVGSQQRSGHFFRLAATLVRNGYIGKVEKFEVGLPTGNKNPPKPSDAGTKPADLDYDLWCGPSPMIPFHQKRFHFHWRWHLNYGGGQLMDWIGHHNDIAHWGMGYDETGPVEVEAKGFEYPADLSVWNAAWRYEIHCKYADGVTSTIKFNQTNNGGNTQGARWYGDKGSIHVSRRGFTVYDKDGKKDAEASKTVRAKDYDTGPLKLYKTPGHERNFIDGVKSRKECICNAETGHRSISPGHLGLASQAVGRKLKFDPKTETVVGDDAADKVLKALPYRAPWKLS
jgi:predicted dehydrogenase